MSFVTRPAIPLLALALLAFAGNGAARTCELKIEGNDRIEFNETELVIEADCTEVTVTLRHVGKLPVAQMGHNWVLTKTADWKAVAQAGQGAGAETDYLPKDDQRIIASTGMVGGGESNTTSLDLERLEQGGEYTFFCSFPGHYQLMNGKLLVK